MGAFDTLELTVINSTELLKKIDENAQKAFSRGTEMLYGAPTYGTVRTVV